ncbi:unnamed protein product [Heterobilharzia americana]|nr:unnamed protein product [Heterobilharzia americana]
MKMPLSANILSPILVQTQSPQTNTQILMNQALSLYAILLNCSEIIQSFRIRIVCQSLPHRIPSNSLLRRLHHLVKRTSSERSIWLHQRLTQKTSDFTNRASKIFRIVKILRNFTESLSGLVAFCVREIISDLEIEVENYDGQQNNKGSNSFAILLLPISGVALGTEGPFSAAVGNCLLGDDLKCGDFVMIFGPWLTYSRESNHLPVMHSFFWVERIKSRIPNCHLFLDKTIPNFQANSIQPQVITCSCLSSCDPCAMLNCPNRFRGLLEQKLSVISESLNSSGDTLTTVFNRKCFLVIGCCRFWILKKIRYILLVWHFSGFPGLILLPNQGAHLGTLSKPDVSYQYFKLGCIYSAEALLQLPNEQLEDGIRKEIRNRLDEIISHLGPQSISNLVGFIRGTEAHSKGELFLEHTNCEINLWEARASNFNLIESNHIHLTLPTPYKSDLTICTRCSVDGSLLIELPEGSLSKDIILDSFYNEINKSQFSSKHKMTFEKCFTAGQKVARVFYLWISKSTTLTLLFTISATSNLSSTGFGVHINIDQALVFSSFLVVDRFCTLDIESYIQHSLQASSLRSSLGKQLYANSVLLQSSKDLNKIRVHQIIFFNGTLIRVDTNRSHVWPICPYCACADFEIHHNVSHEISSKPENLKCIRCSALVSNPLQRSEVEVQVRIKDESYQMPMNKLKEYQSPSVELTLNMASWRLCKLLNITRSNLLVESGLNSKNLINRRLDNVYAIVVTISNKVTVHDSVQKHNTYLKHLYAIELDEIENNGQ